MFPGQAQGSQQEWGWGGQCVPNQVWLCEGDGPGGEEVRVPDQPVNGVGSGPVPHARAVDHHTPTPHTDSLHPRHIHGEGCLVSYSCFLHI